MKLLLSFSVLILLCSVSAFSQEHSGPGSGTIPTVLTDHIFTEKPLSAASDSTLTPDLTVAQAFAETVMANGITINAPTNATHWPQTLFFYFLDNGTTRHITWNAAFIGSPTSDTVVSTPLYVLFELEPNGTQWKVLADSGVASSGLSTKVNSYAYVISLSSGSTIATNQTTGAVDFTNADAGVVLRAAIAACPSGGCGIFIREGTYPINSFGTETGGSLGYKYAISLPNTNSFSTSKSWRITGENPRTTLLDITSTAIATTVSTDYVVGIWGQWLTGTPPTSYTDVILENFAIDFPDNNATRGNTAPVDLTYIYRQAGTNIYGTCDSWNPSGFPLPAQGSVDSVGWRTGDSLLQENAVLTNVFMQECYNGFEAGDGSTFINPTAGFTVNALYVGYPTRVTGGGSLHGLAVPVTMFHPSLTDNVRAILIGTDFNTSNAQSLIIENMYDEFVTAGTFTRGSNNTDNSSSNIGGHISYTHFNGTLGASTPYTFWSAGGTKFDLFDLNQDEMIHTVGSGITTNIAGLTASKCVETDSNKNIVSAAAACGSGGGGTLSYSGGTTTGHCVQVGATSNTLVDSGSSNCGGGGGSVSKVMATRTTSQTYSANSGTPVAVVFNSTDITANSAMHNPAGSGACGAASRICLPANTTCIITAQVNMVPGLAATTGSDQLAGIVITLNGTSTRVAATFVTPQTGTFLHTFGFNAVGLISSGATDYVEVQSYDGSGSGTTTISGTSADAATFSAICQ